MNPAVWQTVLAAIAVFGSGMGVGWLRTRAQRARDIAEAEKLHAEAEQLRADAERVRAEAGERHENSAVALATAYGKLIDQLEQRIKNLEDENSAQRKLITELRDRITGMEGELRALRTVATPARRTE